MVPCSVMGCERSLYSRGLCNLHYQRVLNTGTTDLLPRARPAIERFMEKVAIQPNGCWLWQASRDAGGYARFNPDKTSSITLGHRFIYLEKKGPIPEGLFLDHLCRQRHCVNPDHLEAVTIKENTLRSPVAPAAVNAKKTHCPKGHPYDEINTVRRKNRRWCLACRRSQHRG